VPYVGFVVVLPQVWAEAQCRTGDDAAKRPPRTALEAGQYRLQG
jgi:hypothetical protein